MVLTEYTVTSEKLKGDHTFVMLSDFHNVEQAMADALLLVEQVKPEAILVAGDLVDRHRKEYDLAAPFLSECVKLAPTYFSYGNHEKKFPKISHEEFVATGAEVFNNSYRKFTFANGDVFAIGGHYPYTEFDWMDEFESEDVFKLLICHHPEYYEQGLKDKALDLIVSGHAHGGQIRIFDQGILAPGQGLFPKCTKGLVDNKLVVGTGISNTGGIIPRLGNPTEVVVIHLKSALPACEETEYENKCTSDGIVHKIKRKFSRNNEVS